MILHITNGDAFNEHLQTKVCEIALPFREAMMDGEAITPVFSDAFIRLRAASLDVSEEEYRSKAVVFNILENNAHRYEALCLWFGRDTFCQMNLLTLLAYLEEIAYHGHVVLNVIDDESFSILETVEVALGEYLTLYENLLISKRPMRAVGVISQEAVNLYFDYISDNGNLACLVRKNEGKDELSLVMLLLDASVAYGLSDLQAKKLIKKYR